MKILTTLYLIVLILSTVLPLNNAGTALNNNYALTIRWDYLLHAMVYLPMALLLSKHIRQKGWVLLLGLVLAAGLEALQLLLPWRAFNINDLIANGTGVLIGFAGTLIWIKTKTGSQSHTTKNKNSV